MSSLPCGWLRRLPEVWGNLRSHPPARRSRQPQTRRPLSTPMPELTRRSPCLTTFHRSQLGLDALIVSATSDAAPFWVSVPWVELPCPPPLSLHAAYLTVAL